MRSGFVVVSDEPVTEKNSHVSSPGIKTYNFQKPGCTSELPQIFKQYVSMSGATKTVDHKTVYHLVLIIILTVVSIKLSQWTVIMSLLLS